MCGRCRSSNIPSWSPGPLLWETTLPLAAPRRRLRPPRPPHRDPDEQIEVQVMTLKQAWQMVERGDIIDLKTVAGLGMVSGRIPTRGR